MKKVKKRKKSPVKALLSALVVLSLLLVVGFFAVGGRLVVCDKGAFLKLTMPQSSLRSGELVLVNSSFAYDFDRGDRVVFVKAKKNSSYQLRNGNEQLKRVAIKSFNRLFKQFERETGVNNIAINSAFRSFAQQSILFESRVANYGYEAALTMASKAGYSEHHTGLAADLVLLDSDGEVSALSELGDYSRFVALAAEQGFVVRYSDSKQHITGITNEPWHFRYVGRPTAMAMYNSDLCLEEYLSLVRDYSFDGEWYQIEAGRDSYAAYYCVGRELYLPLFKLFSFSGNNVDGFVVTVRER